MRLRGKLGFALAVLFSLYCLPAFSASPPQRIVTLMPSLGELAADLLPDHLERIVGVSDYTDYPPALASGNPGVKVVGPYARVNLELVAALKPDLVLASRDGNSKDQVEHLKELGIPVLVVDTGSFSDAEDSMRKTGKALGVPEKGETMAKQLETGVARFRQKAALRVKAGKRRRVLIELDSDPLITAGGKTFIGEALEIVGAENVYFDQAARYPRPSLEDVISRAPDTILILAMGSDLAPFRKMAAKWSEFPNLQAVKEKRVRILRADTIVRPTLRALEGLSILEKAVYDGK